MAGALIVVFTFANSACDLSGPPLLGVPVETRFSFVNLSTTAYAALGVRVHDSDDPNDPQTPFVELPLLAPGALFRADFTEWLGIGCPDALDLRLRIYHRINKDLPIGLDLGEEVDPSAVVIGMIENVPACSVQTLVTYTVVNWDAPDGTARVKIAQDTAVDAAIRDSGIFPNVDAAWEIDGVDPSLAVDPPPALAPNEPIAGRVTLANGAGIEGVGVLIRTRFRVRLDDADPTNDPDSGFGEPIGFTITDTDGSFSIDRPAGVYRIEFFSDDLSFRPALMDLETPIQVIQVIAEPL